ncbi:hypothetical protein Halha_2626 [Halobacteroides halobius DSM 5150]|uniref:Uncharacterized protein n=1 Tax=Halobacteroides halobius (strain ATCC 35273 / DSM 5150 / MD-1) TaxID=748449 RepID=L0KEK4_HALHC|nr:hypothetical protein [Halobacteroides halobius]AGB42498.1 hypothetical protein Halha_2626 [Halobacteroides halobius DSM 5150]
MKKLVIALICLIVLLVSPPIAAQVKISTLLTTEGLDPQGNPVTVKRKFSLSQNQGVQYYVSWLDDQQAHNVAVKWFDSQDKLINLLVLEEFAGNIVRDYISFSQRTKTQFFIPDQVGNYQIYLYVDQELIAVTEFKITK